MTPLYVRGMVGNKVKHDSAPAGSLPACRSRMACAIFMAWLLAGNPAWTQSTFGSITGTVRDPSGSVITMCKVTVANQGTSSQRSLLTDPDGNYNFVNLEPGAYIVTLEAPGFQRASYTDVQLTARQTLRIDAQMSVAQHTEAVNVMAALEGVIQTEVSNIAETKTGRELVDLPIALGSRATGSTSPMTTLTTQPGVQTDTSGNISVAGTKPSMLSMSIDGISSMGPRTAGPLTELFPSFNSIAEIRVSEVNNSAEFGGISDITTISKSGSNVFHGGIFENLQNTELNARNPFSASKTVVKMNDFGGYLGGPVSIPKLYNGHDRTFFFGSYEGLRLPRQSYWVQSVPSVAMRSGDLSVYSAPVYQPGTSTPFPGNQIPANLISPLASKALQYLFPLANTGSSSAISNNYTTNMLTPISSNQGDLRLDQVVSSRQSLFARMTYKKRKVFTTPTGSASLGPFSKPETDYGFTAAYNIVITPRLINEVRTGLNGNHYGTFYGIGAQQAADTLGLTTYLPQAPPAGNAVPNFKISGFTATGGTGSSIGKNNTTQVLDSLTWTKGTHAFKFGGDYRRMTGYYSNVFSSSRLGQYTFNGAITGTSGSANAFIGNPYAAFLLGIPDKTQISTVLATDTSSYANHYAFYAQDDWKVSPRLTVNYGLRWEYHPTFQDHFLNVTNFLPDYVSTINGVAVHGAVVIPNDASMKILNPAFAGSIAPTPILTAKQAGIPESLRYSQKTDFAPRFGFAWRPFANGKTVVRGGVGKFIEGPLGSLISAAWGVHASDVAIFNQSIKNGAAALTFPYPFPSNLAVPGSQNFQQAGDIHYKDPSVLEWNITLERDLGSGIAVRVSYDGNHGKDLGTQQNLNQLHANTVGYSALSATAPFPLWGQIQSELNGGVSYYNALTTSVTKKFSNGLQFQGSYVWAKNLTDAQGYNPTAFASEAGGVISDPYNLMVDYGNVAFTRRHRFLGTFLYDLPFGRKGVLLKGANRFLDRLVGGWELAGVVLVQTGPFLTIIDNSADPSGTGAPLINGDGGRVDIVSGVSPYAASQSPAQWFNPAAFALPANNIGRFGNLAAGALTGPGTQSVSISLIKAFTFTERARMQVGAQAANLFNHANYAIPNTTFGTSPFGTITDVQSAEGAGPRALQLTARLIF
jgi:Carboxypeptidase regulatory-like domain/TonB dependent receptor